MIAVIQRVNSARVAVEDRPVAEIGRGLLILLGVRKGDAETNAASLCDRCVNLRIFDDRAGKFDHSLADIKGEVLVVSQFTLLADTRAGRRPSFSDAEEPLKARHLYEKFIENFTRRGIPARQGEFGAKMKVTLENDGPVTIIMEV